MFWKKKNKENGPKKLFKMPTETRGAFRVYPSEENPILVKVDGKEMLAIEISSGGISFENQGFKLGATYSMEIKLPKDAKPIDAKAEVLKIDDTNICRCKILALNPEQEDDIHHYVLSRQKEEIAGKRKYK